MSWNQKKNVLNPDIMLTWHFYLVWESLSCINIPVILLKEQKKCWRRGSDLKIIIKKTSDEDFYDHLDEIVELPPLRSVILHELPWSGDAKGDARHLDVLDEAGLHDLQLPRLHGRPGHQEACGRHRT